MSEILKTVILTEDEELSLVLKEKPSILDIRLSLLFQKYIKIASISEYLKNKRVINVRLNNKSIGYIFICKCIYGTRFCETNSFVFDYSIKFLYRNRKVGQNVLKMMFSEDVFEKLNVSRFVAYICEDNVKSIKCATKAGMVRSGIYYIKSLEH